MPIIDYEAVSKSTEESFFKNSEISEKNKVSVKRYLQHYKLSGVKAATRTRFFAHIKFLLKKLPDFEVQMHDRALVNKTFEDLKKKFNVLL